MVDFTDLDKEKIAEADKHEHRKANTLGADCSVHEEPFGNSEIIFREDIFSETPTASSNFAAPDYGDAPPNGNGGAVATRHIEVALYPVPTSGINGTSTTQTFLTVKSLPQSDDPVDVEAVRIKRLVPPDLSLGRTNAADPDPNFRGFEMALYPAYPDGHGGLLAASRSNESILGLQDGYLDGYQIPATADPSAEYGIGNSARISVDYANGIVRLSAPPLRSLGKSVINPFDVFSERDGYTETTPELGFPTLFATFYEYTGPSLIDTDDVGFVVVGDGTDSYGNFYGPTSTVMQKAVDSLSPLGGTVFVKEGNYAYTSTVFVPENVNVVGLSRRAIITRPNTQAAFKIIGSNASVQGLTIDGINPTSGGAIEIGTQTGSDLENIKILDNFLWANANTRSIAFTGDSGTVTYSNVEIGKNKFSPDAASANHIGDVTSGATVSLDQLKVYGNDFTSTSGNAIVFTGDTVSSISSLSFKNNVADGNVNLNLQHGSTIEYFVFENNENFEDLSLYGVSEGFFSNNKLQNIDVTNGLAQTYINQNEINNVSLDGAITNTRFSKNELLSLTVDHSADSLFITENYITENLVLRGESGVATINLADVIVSNNNILGNLDISNNLTSTGTHTINSLRLIDNLISGSIRAGRNPDSGAVTAITYNDLIIKGNEIGESNDLGEPFGSFVLGEFGSGTDVNLNNLEFKDNALSSDGYLLDNTVFSEGGRSTFDSNNFTSSTGSLVFKTTTLNNVAIENNTLQQVRLFADGYQGGVSISTATNSKNISVKNNKILSGGTISIDPLGTNSNLFTLENYVISENSFISNGNIRVLNTPLNETYSIINSSFDDNYLSTGGSSIVVGSLFNLTDPEAVANNISLSGNRVNGTLTLGGLAGTAVSLSNNIISGKMTTLGSLLESIISDNKSESIEASNNYTDVVISNNSLGTTGFSIDGSFVDVVMSNNEITGPTNIGNITTSTINSNSLANWTSDNITQSSFVGNKLAQFEAQDTLSCSFGNNVATDNVIINQIEDSVVESFSVAGDFTISTSLDSSVLDSTITGNVELDTVTTSDFSNNNIVGTLRVLGTSTDSKYSSNNVVTTGASASVGFGDLLRAKVEGNLFSSTSATEDIFVGDLNNSSWISNDAYQATGQITSFSAIEGSKINSSLFSSTVTLGRVTSSTISTTTFVSDLLITSLSSDTLTGSNLESNIILGNLSILSTDKALVRSKVTDNVIDGYASITSQNICMDSSHFSNNISSSLSVQLADPDATFALVNSSICENSLSSDFTIDASSSSNVVELIENSNVNENNVAGLLSIGLNSEVFGPGILIRDTSISSNTIGGTVTIGPSGRSVSINTYNGFVLSKNIIENSLTVRGTIVGSNFSENSITNSTSVDGVSGSTVSSNIFGDGSGGDTLVFNGDLEQNTLISGNTVISGNTSFEGANSSVIVSNAFGGTVTFNSLVDTLNFSANNVTSNLTFDDYTDLTINGNSLVNLTLNDSGTADNLVCSDNIINNLTVSGSASISNANITSNVINSVNLTSDLADFNFTNNNVQSTFQAQTLIDSNIGSNIFASSVTFDSTITRVNFYNNACGLTLSLPSVAASDLSISGNIIVGSIDFAGGTYTRCIIDSNKINNSLTCTAVFSDSIFSSNTITGAVLFDAVAPTNGGSVQNSILDGNHFGSNVTFSLGTTVGGLETPFFESAFSNNKVGGNLLFDTLDDHSMIRSIVSNNTTDNITISSTDLSCLLQSIISGNVINGNLSVEHSTINSNIMDSSIISDNYINNNLNIAVNNLTGLVLDNCTVSGNSILNDFNMSGSARTNSSEAYRDSVISNNVINADCDINGSLNDSVFSNNQIDGTFDTGDIIRAKFNDNLIGGVSTLAAVTESGIVNNDFKNNATFAVLTESRLSHNRFAGTFSTGTSSVTDSSIIGNIFEGAFSSGGWTSVTCSNNNFISTLTSSTADNPAINNVVFNGNACSGNITFQKTSTGGTDNFTNSSFTGNVIEATLTVGGTASNELTYLNFTGNSGAGNLTLDSSGGASELDGIVIVGNTMNGALTLSDGPYTVPNTSNHGNTGAESVIIIALNTFGTYTNVNFTNDAIGWGNSTTANTGSTVGSNY